jgi:HAD superfamily hydrolase (TIGR01509 family)
MLIEAVIFDMDGLMLDTEPVYRAAWQQTSAECGYVLSDVLYLRLIGQCRHDAEEVLLQEFGLQFPLDNFRAACQKREAAALAANPLRKKHGLDELIEFLDSRHVPKAVATSTDRQIALQMLATSGLLARFDVITTADEVAYGKPSPDIFHLAGQRLGVGNSVCLVLEDAEPGVIAAHRAGMNVYIVPDQTKLPPTVQRLANATFDSLADVTRHLELTSKSSTQLRG